MEHYANRKDSLKHKSVAEFAANFTYSSVHTKTSLPLKNNSGYVSRGSKSRVIRYRNYQYKIDPENYIRENLVLFMPWTNMERLFASHSHTINEKKIFNAFDDDNLNLAMNKAMARTSTNNEDDEEANVATFDFDEYSMEDNFTFADIATELEVVGSREKVFFIAPEKLPKSDFQNLFEKLNQDQRDYIMHVIADHFEKTPDKQLLHFFTGGAGLRPVCATALYFPETSNQYAEIFNEKLWNHFKVYILTKIMRQSEVQFQTALNNLARGKLTKEDKKLSKSRTFSKMPKKKRLHKAIHLFSRNEDVEEYNNKCLKNIIGEETICHASDVFHGHGSQLAKRQMEYTISKSKSHQTMGLAKSIKLKNGAIYMLRGFKVHHDYFQYSKLALSITSSRKVLSAS
ncbi:Oligopeptide transporter 2 [Frankliniella fusca]|uniref:Oligopeptide transporter 2 n=1 Tax=Frankliniella fusca TaxID=407009 RepID=A0AAE1GVQ3_9NEOP|nr:Oligopeptide transporter 2 [Frankliniella fusca]